jgi:hypothetical protein
MHTTATLWQMAPNVYVRAEAWCVCDVWYDGWCDVMPAWMWYMICSLVYNWYDSTCATPIVWWYSKLLLLYWHQNFVSAGVGTKKFFWALGGFTYFNCMHVKLWKRVCGELLCELTLIELCCVVMNGLHLHFAEWTEWYFVGMTELCCFELCEIVTCRHFT